MFQIMFKNRKIQTLAMLAAGGLLGYLAATGDLRFDTSVTASTSEPGVAGNLVESAPASAQPGACCASDARPAILLAQARVKKPAAAAPAASAPAKQPNIIFIMGDDIGWFNIGAYHQGIMAGRTPNLDRLAAGGMRFTDYYAEASCTAGRANFITGELPIRTGLTTVGQAGAKIGMPAEAPTIATALKAMGYATGQFGKNHLGDRNEFLPTVHGFDEFFGYLYHLDAMEDPDHRNYPHDLLSKVGPRNMLHSWATDKDDTTDEPALGRGRQAKDRRCRAA